MDSLDTLVYNFSLGKEYVKAQYMMNILAFNFILEQLMILLPKENKTLFFFYNSAASASQGIILAFCGKYLCLKPGVSVALTRALIPSLGQEYLQEYFTCKYSSLI